MATENQIRAAHKYAIEAYRSGRADELRHCDADPAIDRALQLGFDGVPLGPIVRCIRAGSVPVGYTQSRNHAESRVELGVSVLAIEGADGWEWWPSSYYRADAIERGHMRDRVPSSMWFGRGDTEFCGILIGDGADRDVRGSDDEFLVIPLI